MKSLYYCLILVYISALVFVNGEDEEDDSIIVEDDSESSPAGDGVQTRLFTGNQQLDAGLAGLALGVGGALVVGHLLDQKNKKQFRCSRYKRDADEPSLRFLNFGGGNNNYQNQYCPPGTYPVRNNYNAPSYPHNTQPYYPSPNPGAYNTPYRPSSNYNKPNYGPYNQGSSGYNKPYQPYAPSQGYNPSPYNHRNQFNTPFLQRSPLKASNGNGFKVPSTIVTKPTIDQPGIPFQPRVNLKNLNEVKEDDKLSRKQKTDAVRFV